MNKMPNQPRQNGLPNEARQDRALDNEALDNVARQNGVLDNGARQNGALDLGVKYWRSFEELSQDPAFRAFVEDEFPNRTPDWNDAGSRRKFLTLMGASIAFAGASACTVQPAESLVPYVRQPEDFVPGKPLFYATAMSGPGGIATGVLAESHLGRPTKIEGNPQHPASLGATDTFMQASVLTLYDPDRSQTVTRNGYIATWGGFISALTAARDKAGLKHGIPDSHDDGRIPDAWGADPGSFDGVTRGEMASV